MDDIVWDSQPTFDDFTFGHLNPGRVIDPSFRGVWLFGDALPEGSLGYIEPSDLTTPRVKMWSARPGSVYSKPHGHQRITPAHHCQFDEYVWVLQGELMFIDEDGPPAARRLTIGNGVAKLSPWTRGSWRLAEHMKMASGLTLLFASPPMYSPIVGDGVGHELHIIGPGMDSAEQLTHLVRADHLQPGLTAALIMVFSGSLFCNGRNLESRHFVYVPPAEYLDLPRKLSNPKNLRAAVLFYTT